MRTYFAERIGPKQSLTPEGFLLCEEVPIARTGIQEYAEGELIEDGQIIKGSADGIIYAERTALDLFRPETIASYEGKTASDDHPEEDIVPENWKEYAVGHIQNLRRGTGALADVLLADMIIKDPAAIAAVRAGKREVSCGYDFEIEELGGGRVRQTNIIGNHVALVEQGRCGPRCSIGDEDMTKRTLWDRVATALKAKDEGALKEAMEGGATDADLNEGETSKGGAVVVHVHNGAGSAASGDNKAKDDGEEANKDNKDDPFAKITDSVNGLCKRMDDFGARLDKIEGGKTTDAEKEEDEDGKTKDDGEEANKEGKAKDGKSKDSAGLEKTFKDTIARAEILAPGIKLPAFDRKADPKKTSELMCGFRRRALDKAFATDAGKAAIEPLLTGALDTKSMSCAETRIMFTAASDNMKRANNEDGESHTSAKDGGSKDAPTIESINKKASDFWAKRGGATAV